MTKNRISLPKVILLFFTCLNYGSISGLDIFCTSFLVVFLPLFQSSRVDLNTRNFEKLSKMEKQGKI